MNTQKPALNDVNTAEERSRQFFLALARGNAITGLKLGLISWHEYLELCRNMPDDKEVSLEKNN